MLDEYRIRQRHLEDLRAIVDQLLPIGRLDVVRLNLQEHFAIQVQRVALGNRGQGPLVAGVAVAAAELIVGPGRAQTLLDGRIVREFPQGVLIERQGLAPTTLAFERLAALEQSAHLPHVQIARSGRFGRDDEPNFRDRRRRQRKRRKQPECEDEERGRGPTVHVQVLMCRPLSGVSPGKENPGNGAVEELRRRVDTGARVITRLRVVTARVESLVPQPSSI